MCHDWLHIWHSHINVEGGRGSPLLHVETPHDRERQTALLHVAVVIAAWLPKIFREIRGDLAVDPLSVIVEEIIVFRGAMLAILESSQGVI